MTLNQDTTPPSDGPDDAVTPSRDIPKKRPSVATHYMRYSIGSVLVMLAGFVSFPILTRLLDNTQYGIMGYYNTWVLVAIAFAKLGGQHSIIRFYPHDGDPAKYAHYSTNLVVVPMALSFTLWALVAGGLLAWQGMGQAQFSSVFWCVVLLTPVLVMGSFVQMVVRASERSGIVMATRVLGKFLELGLVLAFVIWIESTALAVFEGRLVAGAVLLAYFIYWSVRNLTFSVKAIDPGSVANSLRYGMPLMVNEFVAMALAASDRVLLKELTGQFAMVGIYTVGYALAQQIHLFMSTALSEAFVPVANRMFSTEGEQGVRELKKRMLIPITYAAIGVAVMVLAIGHDAIVALAGADKARSGSVFIVVGVVMAVYPIFDISSYGLLLRKRTTAVLGITFTAAVVSIIANFIMIPRIGYMGAAWATVFAYGASWTGHFLWCPRGLRQLPELRVVATALGAGAVLMAVMQGTDLFGVQGAWARVFVGGAMFVVLYALPVLLLDPRLRTSLMTLRPGKR